MNLLSLDSRAEPRLHGWSRPDFQERQTAVQKSVANLQRRQNAKKCCRIEQCDCWTNRKKKWMIDERLMRRNHSVQTCLLLPVSIVFPVLVLVFPVISCHFNRQIIIVQAALLTPMQLRWANLCTSVPLPFPFCAAHPAQNWLKRNHDVERCFSSTVPDKTAGVTRCKSQVSQTNEWSYSFFRIVLNVFCFFSQPGPQTFKRNCHPLWIPHESRSEIEPLHEVFYQVKGWWNHKEK